MHHHQANDPPTIVNSTAAHNNKPNARLQTGGGESKQINGLYRYDEPASPANENHQHVTLLPSTGSDSSGGNKFMVQRLVLARTKSDELPDSLLGLSSSFNRDSKAQAKSMNQRDLRSVSPYKVLPPSAQNSMENDVEIIIMPHSSSKQALASSSTKPSRRVVIENMPPHSTSEQVLPRPLEPFQDTTTHSVSSLPSNGVSASKATYLTRKAHQFSSLKKKRNNSLLNKLSTAMTRRTRYHH